MNQRIKGVKLFTLGVSLTLFALSSVPSTAVAQKVEHMSLATSSVGGAWYPFGGAVAHLVGKYNDNLKITAEPTGGAKDNIALVHNNEVQFAMETTLDVDNALKGINQFDQKFDNFSGVLGSGDGIFFQLYTLKKTGIKSIEDLKGKRISLGGPGSVGNYFGEAVLAAYGLEMGKDWKPEYLSHGEGPEALLDGNVDAVVGALTFPAPPIIDITSREKSNVVLLTIEPDILDQLLEEYPSWTEATIPGGTYEGHPDDIDGIFGVQVIMVANNDVSDDAVYGFTKAILENHDELSQMNNLGKFWGKEDALNGIEGIIPLHPGAKKYMLEANILEE